MTAPTLSAAEQARRHAAGTTSPRTTVEQAFARAAEVGAGPGGLNAILWHDREAALGAAAEVVEQPEDAERRMVPTTARKELHRPFAGW